MKIASIAIFLGVMSVGLTYRQVPLHAQSMNAPALTGGDDKPWNRGVSTEVRLTARELFLEGNRLFRVPLFAQAAEKYVAALATWKHPAFYFNLAIAQLNLGQEVEARDNLEQALQHGEEPLGAEEFKEAKKQLHDVERQLGRIHISCQIPGAEVTLDGVALFTGPGSYRGWARAKDHELTAKKRGYLAEAKRVTLSPGNLQEIELKLITLSEAEDVGRRWAVWKPWTVVAGGGAIAVAGGVFHAFSARNFNAYDAKFLELSCAKSTGCTEKEIRPGLNDRLILAVRQQKIAMVSYIAGGSLITTGVVLLYLNQSHLLEQGAANPVSENIAIIPILSTDMVSILISMSH